MSRTPKPVEKYRPFNNPVAPIPAVTATQWEGRRNKAQTALSTSVIAGLERSGKWAKWQAADVRLAPFDSLDAVRAAWRRRDERCYGVVAGLTALGSRRGGDDDDAALAVVVLLAEGVSRLAYRDLMFVCELEDVNATVWEEVKGAEPQLGSHAARYLLQRARQRLTRPAGGMVSRIDTTSLEAWTAVTTDGLFVGAYSDGAGRADYDRDLIMAVPEVEDPVEDLADLLTWATGTGVISADDVALLVELLAAENDGLGREEAQRVVGERHGVTMRTVRRRTTQATERLNQAAPEYLAAIA
ncbi:hypothetical protein JCM18899A_47380 [Nocardioides sp. AN3]|jgi:hypothetical protein